MQLEKIYKVTYKTWTDGCMGDYGHKTHFKGYYLNKEEAEAVYKEKDDRLGYYSRMNSGVFLEKKYAMMNDDGSFNKVTIHNTKIYPT
jgi:hypothetical protein